MNGLKQVSLALATAGVLASGGAQAALNSRGGGTMLYDDVLNITWLSDANVNGLMDWGTAKTWAEGLNYGGYSSGWRLASNSPFNGSVDPSITWTTGNGYDGKSDQGYNITKNFDESSYHSELSYMYYVNLGLKGYFDLSGNDQLEYGVLCGNPPTLCSDIGPVKNLQSSTYWSGTAGPLFPPDPRLTAFTFDYFDGNQQVAFQDGVGYAWAVRDGDVAAPIPEPETYAMLLAGLGLLGVVAKRRRRSFGAS